jgi:protein-disulfide isomerase
LSILVTPPLLSAPVSERDHVVGPETAPVTIVEYGDYECPFCGAAHPVVKAMQRALGANLRFAYRHFPLSQIHRHAYQAAEAAEAAGAQELEPFAADLAEHRHAPKIREDFLSGVRSGVNGTPTFFVNGVRHDGGYDLESMLEAVQLHL